MTDYALAGRVGLRLVDDGERDRLSVERETGLRPGRWEGTPHVEIRYVPRLQLTGPMRFVGRHAAFTDDGFVLLSGPRSAAGRVLVPLDRVGGQVRIVVERDAPRVPLLTEILHLTAVQQGLLPLHAAVLRHRGRGILVVGWAQGGKTETTLALLARGAEVVADEWTYVDPETRVATGFPHPVRLWSWHLQQLPEVRSRLSRRGRARVAAVRRGLSLARGSSALSPFAAALGERDGTWLTLDELAPGRVREQAAIDLVVHVESRSGSDVGSAPADPVEVADRMASSLAYERADLTDAWLAFRHAFPQASNPALDTVGEVESARLRQALAPLPAYTVWHPYPVALKELADCVECLL